MFSATSRNICVVLRDFFHQLFRLFITESSSGPYDGLLLTSQLADCYRKRERRYTGVSTVQIDVTKRSRGNSEREVPPALGTDRTPVVINGGETRAYANHRA